MNIPPARRRAGASVKCRFAQRWSGALLLGTGLLVATGSSEVSAVSPRSLVQTVDLSGPVISPDGRMVAYRTEQASIERNSYETAWYVAMLDGQAPPRKVADGGVPLRNSSGVTLPAHAIWSPDGRWIYYRALIDGRIAVWRAASDGSSANPVTREHADVRAFELADHGRALYYSIGPTREEVRDAEMGEYDSGIRIDASVALGQGLFRSGFLDERPMTQRLKDNEVIRYPLLSGVPDQWNALDLASGQSRSLAGPPEPIVDAPPRVVGGSIREFSVEPEGSRFAVVRGVGPHDGLRAAPRTELAVSRSGQSQGGTWTVCGHLPCTDAPITSIQWRPQSDEIVFTVTRMEEGFAQSIYRWDIAADAVHSVASGKGLLAGGRDRTSKCALSAATMVCVAADARTPPRLERIALDSGMRRVLHDPNEALAWDMARVRNQLLQWQGSDGTSFSGHLFVPESWGAGAVPLVINYYLCHGFIRGGVGDELPFASLARAGIASLCVNRAAMRVNAVERYELGRAAVEGAVHHLASLGLVDPTRVGMSGLSFGSEVTFWTIMYSDVLAAAAVSSPMISPQMRLLAGLQAEPFEQRMEKFWQLGPLDESASSWERISPAFNLERLKIPILMQIPEQEYLHTLDYAVPLIRQGTADMYVFPDEPHQKFQPRHKLSVYQRSLDWFRFWLLNEEDPDPRKKLQYEAWGAMGREGAPGVGEGGRSGVRIDSVASSPRRTNQGSW